MDAVLHKLLETVGEMNLPEGDFLKANNVLKECFEKSKEHSNVAKIFESNQKWEIIITPNVSFIMDSVKKIVYTGSTPDEYEIKVIKKINDNQTLLTFNQTHEFASYVVNTMNRYFQLKYKIKYDEIEIVEIDVVERYKSFKVVNKIENEVNEMDEDEDDCEYFDYKEDLKNSIQSLCYQLINHIYF